MDAVQIVAINQSAPQEAQKRTTQELRALVLEETPAVNNHLSIDVAIEEPPLEYTLDTDNFFNNTEYYIKYKKQITEHPVLSRIFDVKEFEQLNFKQAAELFINKCNEYTISKIAQSLESIISGNINDEEAVLAKINTIAPLKIIFRDTEFGMNDLKSLLNSITEIPDKETRTNEARNWLLGLQRKLYDVNIQSTIPGIPSNEDGKWNGKKIYRNGKNGSLNIDGFVYMGENAQVTGAYEENDDVHLMKTLGPIAIRLYEHTGGPESLRLMYGRHRVPDTEMIIKTMMYSEPNCIGVIERMFYISNRVYESINTYFIENPGQEFSVVALAGGSTESINRAAAKFIAGKNSVDGKDSNEKINIHLVDLDPISFINTLDSARAHGIDISNLDIQVSKERTTRIVLERFLGRDSMESFSSRSIKHRLSDIYTSLTGKDITQPIDSEGIASGEQVLVELENKLRLEVPAQDVYMSTKDRINRIREAYLDKDLYMKNKLVELIELRYGMRIKKSPDNDSPIKYKLTLGNILKINGLVEEQLLSKGANLVELAGFFDYLSEQDAVAYFRHNLLGNRLLANNGDIIWSNILPSAGMFGLHAGPELGGWNWPLMYYADYNQLMRIRENSLADLGHTKPELLKVGTTPACSYLILMQKVIYSDLQM